MLTSEAFNALLKTLEEPPAHVIFILATTEVHKLPLTILSRCQRFDFYRIKPEEIAKRVKFVAEQENVTVTDEALTLLAALCDGAMRDALSLFDRCIALSNQVDAAVVRNAAGLARKDYLFALVNSIMNKNCAKALEIIDTLYNESKDMARLCGELCSHLRTLMLIKTVKNPRQMVVLSDSEYEEATDQANYVTLSDIVFYIDILQKSYERMGKGTNNRTELETAVVRLSSPELDFSSQAVLARIGKLEKQINAFSAQAAQGGVAATAQASANQASNIQPPQIAPAAYEQNYPVQSKPQEQQAAKILAEQSVQPTPARAAVAPSANLDELYANAIPFTQWADVISSLRRYSKTIAAAFEQTNAYLSGDYLLIEADSEMPFKLLRQSAQKDKIRLCVQEVTGKVYRLGPYKKPDSAEKPDEKIPLDQFIEQMQQNGVEVEIE
jgi:DNA polymerase-3 subunit gamma/tau